MTPREQNRLDFPVATAFIDAMRVEFPNLVVLFVREGGKTLGVPQ